jgi:hypothetical protein
VSQLACLWVHGVNFLWVFKSINIIKPIVFRRSCFTFDKCQLISGMFWAVHDSMSWSSFFADSAMIGQAVGFKMGVALASKAIGLTSGFQIRHCVERSN